MKKIEAVAYFDRHGEIFQSVENLLPTDTPLYNREALEAVAAHMRDIVCAEASRTLGVEWIWMDADFKRIIDQLTGE